MATAGPSHVHLEMQEHVFAPGVGEGLQPTTSAMFPSESMQGVPGPSIDQFGYATEVPMRGYLQDHGRLYPSQIQSRGPKYGAPQFPLQPTLPNYMIQQQRKQQSAADVTWMPTPLVGNCPVGLEYLTQLDQVLVQQQLELYEVFTGWETENRYQIKNTAGQMVYFAFEESTQCMRQCCGSARGFIIHLVDHKNTEVLRCERQFRCCCGCCWCALSPCCAMEVRVEAPPGNAIGYIRQRASWLSPTFDILDDRERAVLKLQGPPGCVMQGFPLAFDQEFQIQSKDMRGEVGKICKQWSGLVQEIYTDADNFGVTFPLDLDVKIKAVMIGAVFLIDFMYFETDQATHRSAY